MSVSLHVQIKRVDYTLPLPAYHSPGAAGFDLLCRERRTIAPGEVALLPANVIVATPPGYMLLVAARSSTPRRKGLSVPHGVGIIDQDYCGPEDEIHVQVYNFTGASVVVERGERIAQGIFVRVNRAEWDEVDALETPTRGGFGSTG
ncbi:MAG: dUTP diphosphatase [Chloroflexi bacterium]|nr:dUTP diphosphatase [Chloroflexota bacterium]